MVPIWMLDSKKVITPVQLPLYVIGWHTYPSTSPDRKTVREDVFPFGPTGSSPAVLMDFSSDYLIWGQSSFPFIALMS